MPATGTGLQTDGPAELPDEQVLDLLLHLQPLFARDEQSARKIHTAALTSNGSELSFDELTRDHYLRIVWGRMKVSFEVSQAVKKLPDSELSAFKKLLADQFADSHFIDDQARADPSLQPIIEKLDSREARPENLICRNPAWVAARLWDRIPAQVSGEAGRLRLWVDRWHLLGSPRFNPVEAWLDAEAIEFWQAVKQLLETEADLLDWQELRASVIGQIAISSRQSIASASKHLDEIPTSFIGRALWLEQNSLERFAMGSFGPCRDVSGPVWLILEWLKAAHHSAAPHPMAADLFALAEDRPELLSILMMHFRFSPRLLADLLLHPPTTALACLVVARWESPGGAWDRELTSQDDEHTKNIAFIDAVSIMGWFLTQGTLPPAEVAPLVAWVHSRAATGFIDEDFRKEKMLTALRQELVSQSSDLLLEIVAELQETSDFSLGTPAFSAAIDLIDIGGLANTVTPETIVSGYQRAIVAGGYGLGANRIGLSASASLFAVASRHDDLRQAFLHPINIKYQLAHSTEANPFTRDDTLARSLRVHIRILSRAIAGVPAPAPAELVSALIDAVKQGALQHLEKGRIPAFAARYEANLFSAARDRPIAADLGAALNVLSSDDRNRLFEVILETDEPMMLAELLAYAPLSLNERLKARIGSILPEDAGLIHSLPEAQARIEALLSNGLPAAAARFMAAEEQLQTLGKPPGREMTRWRSRLRLLFIQGDWQGIAQTELPAGLAIHDQQSVNETLSFYKALAALNAPGGDKQGAEQAFAHLQNRHPATAAYAINLFAARISLLLEGNIFGELFGDSLLRGNQILIDAEAMMSHSRGATAQDHVVFNSNKGILLLATRNPRQALELLTSLRGANRSETITAYIAIALARLGQTTEALASLEQRVKEIGGSELIKAAREHIMSGFGFAATVDTASDNNPVPGLKAALWDFSQLDHRRQAEVLKAAPDSFFSYVLDQVRFAAASLTSLVPMMRAVSFEGREDDLNALIGQFLAHRVHLLNWFVADQTFGGFTAAGNPGERDLVLRRDSAELAIIEAVICEGSIDRSDLAKHFVKLFAYSNCRLFFHLTYSYLDDRYADLYKKLEEIAENDAPPPFTFQTIEPLSSADSRPGGFVARYSFGDDQASVVFLILDLGQTTQRNAAKALKGKS